jgi:hypothetical protein
VADCCESPPFATRPTAAEHELGAAARCSRSSPTATGIGDVLTATLLLHSVKRPFEKEAAKAAQDSLPTASSKGEVNRSDDEPRRQRLRSRQIHGLHRRPILLEIRCPKRTTTCRTLLIILAQNANHPASKVADVSSLVGRQQLGLSLMDLLHRARGRSTLRVWHQ